MLQQRSGDVGRRAPRSGHAAAADVGLEEQRQRLLHGGGGVPGGPVVPVQGAVQQPGPERGGVRVGTQDVAGFGGGLRVRGPLQDMLEGAAGQRGGMEERLRWIRA